jgi:hypothetical protein
MWWWQSKSPPEMNPQRACTLHRALVDKDKARQARLVRLETLAAECSSSSPGTELLVRTPSAGELLVRNLSAGERARADQANAQSEAWEQQARTDSAELAAVKSEISQLEAATECQPELEPEPEREPQPQPQPQLQPQEPQPEPEPEREPAGATWQFCTRSGWRDFADIHWESILTEAHGEVWSWCANVMGSFVRARPVSHESEDGYVCDVAPQRMVQLNVRSNRKRLLRIAPSVVAKVDGGEFWLAAVARGKCQAWHVSGRERAMKEYQECKVQPKALYELVHGRLEPEQRSAKLDTDDTLRLVDEVVWKRKERELLAGGWEHGYGENGQRWQDGDKSVGKIIFVEGLGKVKVVKFTKQSKGWTSRHTVRPLQRIAALPDLRLTQDFERRQITFRYDAVHKSWVADLYLRRKHDDRDLRWLVQGRDLSPTRQTPPTGAANSQHIPDDWMRMPGNVYFLDCDATDQAWTDVCDRSRLHSHHDSSRAEQVLVERVPEQNCSDGELYWQGATECAQPVPLNEQ